MKYIYQEIADSKYWWKDSSGKRWSYQKQKTEPVFGDVSSKYETSDELVADDSVLEIGTLQTKVGCFKKVAGYIPCTDEQNNPGSIRIIRYAWKRILFLTVLPVLLLLMAGLYLMDGKPKDAIEDVTFPVEMENTDEGTVSIPDYTILEKQEDENKSMTWLYNVSGNPYALQYVIYLNDDNKLLYKSDILQPGQVIRGFTPFLDLESGNYSYKMEVNMYALDDLESPISVQVINGEYFVYNEENND